MRDGTKIKYLKIIRAYAQLTDYFGENAPYISKSRMVELIINKLDREGIKTSRSVIYEAFKNARQLKKERFLLDA